MALGRRADALHAVGGHINRRGVTGRGVVDDLIEIKNLGGRDLFIAITALGRGIVHPHPLVRFAGIIQTEIVINGLGRQHGGQALGQRLQAVEGTVAADANEPLDAQLFQPRLDNVEVLLVFRIHIIAGRTDERAALGGVELGDFLKERVEMNVGDARIEQAVEPLDEPENLDLELVRPHHRAVDGRVQGGRVAAGGQNADAFHTVRTPARPRPGFGPPAGSAGVEEMGLPAGPLPRREGTATRGL